jgi:hypothetical protein
MIDKKLETFLIEKTQELVNKFNNELWKISDAKVKSLDKIEIDGTGEFLDIIVVEFYVLQIKSIKTYTFFVGTCLSLFYFHENKNYSGKRNNIAIITRLCPDRMKSTVENLEFDTPGFYLDNFKYLT